MTVYSLVLLLSLFWTSQLFHFWFCCFLPHIQVSQETGKVIWYFHLFKNFPQFVVIHTVKSFCEVSEVDVSLKFLCFLYDPTNVSNLISGFSAFSKSSLYIWKFSVHILLKPRLKAFEHCLASMWNKCHYTVSWIFFVCVCYLISHVLLIATPWTEAHQAPLPWNSPGKNTQKNCIKKNFMT